MNFRTTLVLLGVLIVVMIVVLVSRDSGGPKTEDTTPAKLLDIPSSDVTRVSFTNDDGQHVVLNKSDGKWRMTEPVNAAADDVAANGLVDAITSLSTRGQVDAVPDTGLDKPRFKVELATKANKTIKLDVGSRTGAGNHLYIRRDGQARADVVPAALYDQLDKPLKQWRRSQLLEVSSPQISAVRIATTQGSLAMEKKADSTWKIAQPTSMPADSGSVTDITTAIAGLKAEDFVTAATDQAAKYGLDRPVMTVAFSTAAPATQPSASQPSFITIQFGRFDDLLKKNVYASVSSEPGVVKVSASSLDSFRKKPLDLRDKALFSVDADKVTKISISTDKPATTQPTTREASHDTVVLERNKVIVGPTLATTMPATGPATTQMAASQPAEPPSKWKLASKDGADADDSKVDQVLNELRPMRADRFVESETPTTQPASATTLTIESTDATYEVRLTDPGGGKPVSGMYNGLNFEISKFVLDNIQADFVKKPGSSSPPPMSPPSGMPFAPPGSP